MPRYRILPLLQIFCKKNIDNLFLLCLNYRITDEAEVKTVYALYRESEIAETWVEMRTVKWAAEGMVKCHDVWVYVNVERSALDSTGSVFALR